MDKLREVNDIICQKIDNVELTRENIGKMLEFDIDISGVDYHAFIYGNQIMNYGLDDAKYDISFEDYVKEFKGVCNWGIAGGGACETPEELLKKFNELGLTYKDDEKMTNEEKKEMKDIIADEIFANHIIGNNRLLITKEDLDEGIDNYIHKEEIYKMIEDMQKKCLIDEICSGFNMMEMLEKLNLEEVVNLYTKLYDIDKEDLY